MLISPFTKKIGWGISIKFCPIEGGGNLNKLILKSSNTWGVGQGQDVEALNWWMHNLTYLLKYVYNVYNLVTSMEHSKIRVLKKNPNFKPSYFILWCSTTELTENLWFRTIELRTITIYLYVKTVTTVLKASFDYT